MGLVKPKCSQCKTTDPDTFYITATFTEPGFAQSYKQVCRHCFGRVLAQYDEAFNKEIIT